MYTVSQSDFVPLDATSFSPFYEASAPRNVVVINGTRYVPVKTSITMNAHGATDEATISLPISSNPDFTAALFQDSSLSESQITNLAANPSAAAQKQLAALVSSSTSSLPIYAEIYSGFPNDPSLGSTDISQLTQRFLGIVDTYTATFTADGVEFKCRSLGAPLVDNTLTFSPPNGMTSVAFIAQVAAQYGLKTNVQLATKDPITIQETFANEFIGGSNFVASITKKKVWDILLATALFDDADVWVSLDTLNYCSPTILDRTTIALQYGRDIANPVGTHSPEFSRDVQVEVRTYQKKTKTSTTTRINSIPGVGGTTVTSSSKTVASQPVFGTSENVSTTTSPTGAVATSVSSSSGGGYSSGFTQPASESGKQRYVYYIPNLAPARANQIAQALWRQISMHEYSLSFDLPVTKENLADLSITALLQMSGLPYTFFNDKYWPRRIQEDFDPATGWKWSIEALNHTLAQGAV